MSLLQCSRISPTLVMLVLAAQARSAEVDKYLPNDTDMVVTLNVRQVLDSPLVKKNGLAPLQTFLKNSGDAQQILGDLGFDPLKGIERVVLAIPGDTSHDKGLLIVHGRFDTAKFAAKALEASKDHDDVLKIQKAGDHNFYEVNAPSASAVPLFVAVLDETTLVASGGKEYVTDAIDKQAGKKTSEPQKDVRSLIEKTDGKQSLWLVAAGTGLKKSPLAGTGTVGAFIGKIRSLRTGMTLGKDLETASVLVAESADAARDIAKDLKEHLETAKTKAGAARAQKAFLAPLAELLETTKVSTEGETVTAKARATGESLETSLQSLVKWLSP